MMLPTVWRGSAPGKVVHTSQGGVVCFAVVLLLIACDDGTASSGGSASTAPEPADPESSASSTEDSADDVAAFAREEPPCPRLEAAAGSESVTFEGRVLDASGAGLPGAAVRVVAWRGLHHPCPSVEGESQSDASGAFSVEVSEAAVPGRMVATAIVAERGLDRRGQRVHTLAGHVVRLVPTRVVPIRLRCTEPPGPMASNVPETGVGEPVIGWPSLEVRFEMDGGNEEPWLRRDMRDVPAHPSVPTTVVDMTIPSEHLVPPDQREFVIEQALPIGPSRLVFSGACGFGTEAVTVAPGDGPAPPVLVELPRADSGTLVIRLVGSVPAGSGSRYVWLTAEGREVGAFGRLDATTTVRRLPPGTYVLRGRDPRPRCLRTVDIEPNGTTEVEIPADSCTTVRPGR